MTGRNNRRTAMMFKLLLVGDSGVGKSCCLLRFIGDPFTPSFISTVGLDFKVRTFRIDGEIGSTQIFDTAGQEKFNAISIPYYRGAMGVFLVYDITNELSFNNIRSWVSKVEQYAAKDTNMILVGNKCEWEAKRVVSTRAGEQLAGELGIPFLEVSAKNNINIENAFLSLVAAIKKRLFDTVENDQPVRQSVAIKPIVDGSQRFPTCC